MAYPTSIGVESWLFTRGGPFLSSAGDTYFVGGLPTPDYRIDVRKASDPSSSWASAGVTDPDGTSGQIHGVDAVQDGDNIHVVVRINGKILYRVFSMASDTWQGSWTQLGTDPAGTSYWENTQARICLCSDGDLVVAWNQMTSSPSGYTRVKARRWDGLSWGPELSVDALGTASQSAVLGDVVAGADGRAHIFWSESVSDSTATVKHRTLTSAGSLGAEQTVASTAQTASPGAAGAASQLVGLGDSRDAVVYIPFQGPTSRRLSVISGISNSDTPTWTVTGTVIAAPPWTLNYFQGSSDVFCGIAVDAFHNRHLVWVDSSSRNVYRDINTGSGWGTDIDVNDATAVGAYGKTLVRDDGHAYLALVYSGGTTGSDDMWYHEIDLGVVAQNVSPSGFQDTATFGTPMVTPVSTVSPTGVASTAALGTPSVNHTIPAPGGPLEISDFSTYNSNTNRTEHELAMPDHSEGDLLVAAFSPDGPGGQITLPDGWSVPQGLTDLINVDNVSSTVATKVATSSEPASYTFKIQNTERAVGAILAISGHDGIEDAAQAWDSQAVIANEALVPLPTVTTTVANCLILYLVTIDFGDDTDRTDPEGVARLLDIELNSGAGLWVGYEYLGVPGESPERILTLSAEEGWHAWTIAIKPAPGGSYTIVTYPQGIASAAAVGEPTVAPGAVTVTPDGIASTAAVGSPAVSGGNALSPSGIASTVAVGVPTLTPGPVSVSPTGLASGAAVGAPNVTPGGVTVEPEGIAPTTAIGLALAETVGLLAPIGLASTAALGTPTVVATYTLTPASIAPTTDFGLLWFYTTVTVKVPEGLKANVRIGVIGAARKFRPTGLQVAVRELGLRRPVYRRRRRP